MVMITNKDKLLKSIKAFAYNMWEEPGNDIVYEVLQDADAKDGNLREDYLQRMEGTLMLIVKMINGECVCGQGGPYVEGHKNCPLHNNFEDITTSNE